MPARGGAGWEWHSSGALGPALRPVGCGRGAVTSVPPRPPAFPAQPVSVEGGPAARRLEFWLPVEQPFSSFCVSDPFML